MITKRQTSNSQPKNLRDLKNMIAARVVVFNGQSERVIRIALEKPELIAFGTLQSIATECSVAPTTIVRVARLAGFANFADSRQCIGYTSGGLGPGQRARAPVLPRYSNPDGLPRSVDMLFA